MQYFNISFGDHSLTSDGLNVWVYKESDKDIRNICGGYSTDFISLKKDLDQNPDSKIKDIASYISEIADIEEECFNNIELADQNSMCEAYRNYIEANKKAKKKKNADRPCLVIKNKNYSINNDGMAIWITDENAQGDRVSGWCTSYTGVLKTFMIHLMNTEKKNDLKLLRKAIENDRKIIEELMDKISKNDYVML